MKIIFLFPYPLKEAPSQRFRFEQYFEALSVKGITFSCHSFWSKNSWVILYHSGKYWRKFYYFLVGCFKRIWILFKIPSVDYVFIHRECLPIGPPIIEWLIGRILKKKIIYDFDDAIWLPNTSNENRISSFLKWHSKVNLICKWSYKISCGNKYLSDYAKTFNTNVIINPTTIDTKSLHNPSLFKPNKAENVITIGWTGSHSTLKYLELITPVIQRLESQFENLRFLVIANKKPVLKLKSMVFLPWTKANEINDLINFDIGVMPLSNDIWSNGKCGFKALQYMALGIPAVASPVGINSQIVDHGVNGFLCESEEEWFSSLSKLILNPNLRAEFGIVGRKKIINSYSVFSNTPTFLSLFE